MACIPILALVIVVLVEGVVGTASARIEVRMIVNPVSACHVVA